MKIEDNHYTYRIETKDSNGGSLDFIDIDTVEPLRCAYDVQDELNLETNEHIKRVEEVVLDANSTEFWYVDEVRTSNTHLVCYFEEVELMASKDHPMVDTNRSVFEYGKINSNEHQDTNFICTHVMDNGVSRLYMSIDKTIFEFATFNNETIKHFISNNPVTVWYALRYEIIIPRSMSKGHLLTLGGQTDITLTTTSEQAKLPIMKFNIGDTQYTLDTNPIHINNTQEGTQIRNIVLEGNTPINYARGNGVNTTEATSNTRYDFTPFYDGQATIQGTVEGGYVSAKLYGDTMVNIAKPYGESPLLTATSESALCDDLLGMNEEGIVLADGEITEGRIYGDSLVNMLESCSYAETQNGSSTLDGEYAKITSITDGYKLASILVRLNTSTLKASTTYYIKYLHGQGEKISEQISDSLLRDTQNGFNYDYGVHYTWDYENHIFTLTPSQDTNCVTIYTRQPLNSTVRVSNCVYITDDLEKAKSYNIKDGFNGIGSVVNPTVYSVNENLFDFNMLKNGTTDKTYIEIPLNIQQGVKYHYMDDYGQWNGSGIYSAALTGVREDDSTVTIVQFINSGGSNRVYQNFTVSTTNKYKKITLRFPLATRDTILSKVTKMGVFEGSYYEHEITPHKHSQATFPYTLNKLPNGVADYIDVVNKVHVQRVGVDVINGSDSENWILYNRDYTDWTTRQWRVNISKQAKAFDIISRSSSSLCDKLNFGTISDGILEDYEHYRGSGMSSTGNSDNLYIWLDKAKATDVNSLKTYLQSNPITVLYELETPIYTPLTEEEIAQLPLSAYADGSVNLSSDQLMPSFEFRMKASNRYQVDMLETGYYYLNAPVGNVKLGTANVDVQQMPCIVKVDNVGSGDSGYRLSTVDSFYKEVSLDYEEGYLSINNGTIAGIAKGRWASDYIEIPLILRDTYIYIGSCEGVDFVFYDENKTYITGTSFGTIENNYKSCRVNVRAKYIRLSGRNDRMKIDICSQPIILAKLPSHRIPTSFTQGMRCVTDFGYWEEVRCATGKELYVNETNKLDFAPIELNRIEYGNTIVEDEFDIATGKFTKRIGKYTIDGNSNLWEYSVAQFETATHMSFGCSSIPNFKKGGRCVGFLGLKYGIPNSTNSEENWSNLGVSDSLYFRFKKDRYSQYGNGADGVKSYFNANPTTICYELEVPEISYINLSSNQVKTVANSTLLQSWRADTTYLNPQVKPSHLTYPVPSLVGNRTYTVVHNRKNITGSTKPIELNLGGTVVQLNDASSKTLVKTPSTLAHSNLIFIGGESTVDHIMVLDGDWTNKPVEYFENMMGHDTDAIITIIGNGQIDDVEEQYLW